MCFSASASFVTAGLTGLAGVFALSLVRRPREIPLAAFPLLFGIQQFTEGVLWLQLSSGAMPAPSCSLATSFVFFAQIVWPILVPIAIRLVEPRRRRRHALAICALAGLLVAGSSLIALIETDTVTSIVGRSIRYSNDFLYFSGWPIAYALSTALPPLLSSHRAVRAFGGLVAIGYGVSAYFYERTLTSVWCFFAAAASIILVFQFVRGFAHAPRTARETA